MADVLLRFRLQALERAEAATKKILVEVGKAKDLAREVKREIVQGARERLKDIRAQKDDALRLDRLGKRAEALRDRAASAPGSGLQGLRNTLREGRKNFFDFVGNPIRDVAAGNTTGGLLGLAGELGGPFVKLVTAAVLAKVLAHVDERIAQEVALRSTELSARLEELRYQADYQRRLEEEPAFRRKEAGRFWQETKLEEKSLADGGLSRSADFLDGF